MRNYKSVSNEKINQRKYSTIIIRKIVECNPIMNFDCDFVAAAAVANGIKMGPKYSLM